MEIWEPKPPGTLWATAGMLQDCFTFLYIFYGNNKDESPINTENFFAEISSVFSLPSQFPSAHSTQTHSKPLTLPHSPYCARSAATYTVHQHCTATDFSLLPARCANTHNTSQ